MCLCVCVSTGPFSTYLLWRIYLDMVFCCSWVELGFLDSWFLILVHVRVLNDTVRQVLIYVYVPAKVLCFLKENESFYNSEGGDGGILKYMMFKYTDLYLLVSANWSLKISIRAVISGSRLCSCSSMCKFRPFVFMNISI